MKKLRVYAALLSAILLLGVLGAFAGAVYDYATLALSATAGTGTWTNTVKYASIKIARLSVARALLATDTVTVTRVISSSGYTDTVWTAVCSGSVASFSPTNYWGLKYGDTLVCASGTGTGATVIVEYEAQEH